MDAYLGSLPGHGVENVRRPLFNTMNLADLLPTRPSGPGSEAPCPLYPPLSPPLMHCVTQGATPFRLNLHVRDVGHTFLFGPTGAGKSTPWAHACPPRRYPGMAIYAFDKGLSLYPLARAAGGRHFTVAADDDREKGGGRVWPFVRCSFSTQRATAPGPWNGSIPSWRSTASPRRRRSATRLARRS